MKENYIKVSFAEDGMQHTEISCTGLEIMAALCELTDTVSRDSGMKVEAVLGRVAAAVHTKRIMVDIGANEDGSHIDVDVKRIKEAMDRLMSKAKEDEGGNGNG